MSNRKQRRIRGTLLAAAAAVPLSAAAGVSSNSSTSPVMQGQTSGVNNPAETITFEGQGSLAKVIGTPAFAYLNLTGPNATTSITLHNGPGGAPVTYSNTNTSSSAFLNLASGNFTAADVGVNSPSTVQQTHSALRLEWHWNGTVDGSNDLINDQVGYDQSAGSVSPQGGASRGPTIANPIYVNSLNHFDGTQAGVGPNNLATLNGFTLSQNTGLGTYNTYSASNYDPAGNNLLGGMNRVQFSFSDYKTYDYSVAGKPSVFAKPGSAGYAAGNPALTAASGNLLGIGVPYAREAYQAGSIANMPTTNVDPGTVSTANPGGTLYAAGPWNAAGTDNLSSTAIGANAVLIAANPGTGLSRLNKGDSQWLQTTGRLANGLQFNAVTRDADLGQRPAFATATGIDGTWAVGVNDGGDSTISANAVAQRTLGTMKFSGKSADSEVYNTIVQSRMAAGVLALTSTIAANSYGPVRSLHIDFTDVTDPQLPGGGVDASKFIGANLNTISDYSYAAVLLGYATTVKAPNATALAAYKAANPGLSDTQAWAQISSFNPSNPNDPTATGIKGDTTGDVAQFLSNLINSQASYASLTTTNDPADALMNNSYLLPNLLKNNRDPATGAITANPNYDAAGFQKATAIYANKFNADLPSSFGKVTETTGASSNYGSAVAGGQSPATFNGNIPITALNADGSVAADGVLAPRGNWLFGNFNQNGVRDLSAVESSLAAAKALYAIEPTATTAKNSAFAAVGGTANASNGASVTYTDVTGVPHTITKGDLIVLGDFQSTGKLDGGSLLAMARGAAGSDATGAGYTNGTLAGGAAGFTDSVRSGVLRKNDALAYMQANTADAAFDANGAATNASAFLRLTARNQRQVDYGTNADGALSFSKLDVDHKGVIDRNTAAIVDKFLGQDYTDLSSQLAATINAGPIAAGKSTGDQRQGATNQYYATGTQVSFNLADAKLTDGGSTVIDRSDFAQLQSALAAAGTPLVKGDANFDGQVDGADLLALVQNFGAATPRWGLGNFENDATVDGADLLDLVQNFGAGAPAGSPALASYLTPAYVATLSPELQADFAAAGLSVPEPTSVSLAALAIAGLATRRRRRRRAFLPLPVLRGRAGVGAVRSRISNYPSLAGVA